MIVPLDADWLFRCSAPPQSSLDLARTEAAVADGLGKQEERVLLAAVAKIGKDRIEKSWSCPIEVLPAASDEPAKRAHVIALTGLDRPGVTFPRPAGHPDQLPMRDRWVSTTCERWALSAMA